MAKVRVVMNSAGAKAILNSVEVQRILLAEATRVESSANSMLRPRSHEAGKFIADVQEGKGRAHARVRTAGVYPIRHNLRHNTLLKALG